MNREDCRAMIISKKCHDQPMTCQGDSCQSILEPKIKFAWSKLKIKPLFNF